MTRSELPADALLRKYLRDGCFVDCYATEIARPVSLAQFVEAFYTTAVFKLERAILRWLVAKPSTDIEAQQLAAGRANAFAAWTVEGRSGDQLLMCDFLGRTRSWLMVAPHPDGARTQLFFGSAIVPVTNAKTGRASLGFSFHALLGFHKLYSRVLLAAARARVTRRAGRTTR